jgi:hypothetical protein
MKKLLPLLLTLGLALPAFAQTKTLLNLDKAGVAIQGYDPVALFTDNKPVIAAILLLTPRFAWAGALLALGVISGALVSHLTVLGIVVEGDGGLLFGLAVAVFVTSAVTAFLHRRQIPVVSQLLKPQTA